jgi:hypothetical protein
MVHRGGDLLRAVHDATVALGAKCSRCRCGATQSTRNRTKALDRGATRAVVMVRAQLRRFNLDQDINLTVAETESARQRH